MSSSAKMELKAATFVAVFSATLFDQWAQQHDQTTLFWRDAAFLRQVLEDGVAKLPNVAVKGLLTRELPRFVVLLQTQLKQKYAEHQFRKASSVSSVPSSLLLLSEEDVERALAAAVDDEATAARIESVLAIDDTAAARIQTASQAARTASDHVHVVEQCVAQLRVVRARRFESADERARKRAFFLEQVRASAAAAATLWGDTWVVEAAHDRCVEREALRVLLQSLVASDLVRSWSTPAAGQDEDADEATPWSSFYRPQEGAVFRTRDVNKARAGVYGALLALAVSFPVVYEEDDTSDDASSSSSSEEEEEEEEGDDTDSPSSRRRARQTKKRKEHEDCVALATHVARQVVLAAKSEPVAADWFLAVLASFHSFAKPTKVVDDDDDDEQDDGLSSSQQRALHDALAELYARAFTGSASLWAQRQHAPLALLEALLCLRHAAEFLRVARKQTVPSVSSATAQLAGVALPAAFWKWMLHVKKVFAGQHAAVQSVMKKLSKHKADKKMANVVLHDSVLTVAELRVVVEQFALFLEAEKERAHFVVSRAPTAAEQQQKQPQGDDDGDNGAQTLFFMDNDGGSKTKKRGSAAGAGASDGEKRKRGHTTAKS